MEVDSFKRANKEIVSKNVFWRFLEHFGAQIVTFVVSIILARILNPSVYGLIALTTVFITIMQVFVESGLGVALIQKKDVDELDFSTVFFFNIVFCLFLYFALFALSPLIARFYDSPELKNVIRVLGLTIIISAVKNVLVSFVSRNMLFKKFFFSTLGGTIGASVVGISLALLGYGIWALVFQMLFNNLVDTIILWITVRWKPKLKFSFKRLKPLFSFGWKILLSKLIDTIYEDVRSLVIGKKYSASDLAYYNKAKQMPQMLVSSISTSVDGVLFSSLSREQDDKARMKAMTSKTIRVLAYIIFPMMMGLIVCSEPFIITFLTEKWSESIPYMRIFCCGLALVPISLMHLNVIKAAGKGKLFLLTEILRKTVSTASLLIAMWFGVKAIAISYLINCIINLFINSYFSRKIIGYKLSEQLKDLFPALFLSVLMGVVVYSLSDKGMPQYILLIIQVPLGILTYLFLSVCFKNEEFFFLKKIVKERLTSKKNKKTNNVRL